MSRYDGEDFTVAVEGSVNAEVRVYGYAPDGYRLADWFDTLGDLVTPWTGERQWESLEGEFAISASCTQLGHVHFQITLRESPGLDEEALINVGLESELGQLEHISNEARKFFRINA